MHQQIVFRNRNRCRVVLDSETATYTASKSVCRAKRVAHHKHGGARLALEGLACLHNLRAPKVDRPQPAARPVPALRCTLGLVLKP